LKKAMMVMPAVMKLVRRGSKSMENENGGMMEENCKKDVFMWGVMEGHDSGGLRNKDKPAEVIEAIKKDIHIPLMCTIAQRFE